MARWLYLCLLAAAPVMATHAAAPDTPRWFSPPPPRPGMWLPPAPAHRWRAFGQGAEEIRVIGNRAPTQRDPYERAAIEKLRTYEAGASWGSTHPGEFCCASQYETGLDGQAGR